MLLGKSAFVTGAGGGIGRAICKVFAREGARVVAADVDVDNAKETTNLLASQESGENRGHIALELDVTKVESVNSAVNEKLDNLSLVPTIIVNSAGITRDNFLLKLTAADFEKVLQVNLTGTFLVTQATVEKMIRENVAVGASVINIASIIGKVGNIGQSNYSASKAGVEAFTKSASMEFGKFGVRVNAVLPGLIDTRMTNTIPDNVKSIFLNKISLGRIGTPEEVAELVLFLASERSSYITGASIEVTGGFH